PMLRPTVDAYWRRFSAHLDGLQVSGPRAEQCLQSLPRVWACSEFAARVCLRQPQLLLELIESGDLTRRSADDARASRVRQQIGAARDETELKQRLRSLRRRELLRIAWRDLAGWSDLQEVMLSLSTFADACISAALDWLYAAAVEKHGTPIGEHSARPVPLIVLGLGKLGGCELNFSSDVDLMFAYAEGGRTAGPRPLSNHEFFVELGRQLINALGEVTEDGFVFRVDMRLRPNGQGGELVMSFDAMEQYYQIHGREWERYAMIKARVVAGDPKQGEELLARLRPFVFRKYLDYSAVEAIREMKVMINRELVRKGMRENIKLGPGGIREIEFIGQAFQLIRGGREPELQERGILKVLNRLAQTDQLVPQTATDLANAYCFLRRTENRLQMISDRQTHQLPRDPTERCRLATAMGHAQWESFEADLREHAGRVQRDFDQVFAEPQHEHRQSRDHPLTPLWLGSLDRENSLELLGESGFDKPEDALALLRGLREGPTYTRLSSEGRSRLDRLMPLLLGAAARNADPGATLVRLIKLVESIGRRSAYLVLLVENPVALTQLVKLYSASAWIATWISQHPILLDELLHPAGLYAPASRSALAAELTERLTRVAADDLELQMDVLREFRHGHVLRVAAADIGPGLEPEEVGMHLAHIADVVLEHSLRLAMQTLVSRYGEPTRVSVDSVSVPGFAIVAYGKLGSAELGYSSDLDMIFLYEGSAAGGETRGPRNIANEVFFSRLGQRLIHMLTTRTRAGLLYEVDMRLRPSGQSGPLVTSLSAFRDYQREHAWTWEHQALLRARVIAGKPELCQAFETVRHEILCMPRDSERLRADVKAMREKMLAAQATHESELFDVKHDRGGIVDIEFMVQYWVLLWAARHPELARHTDNLSILGVLADSGLLPAGQVQLLVDAYKHYLSTEHHLRLTEQKSLIGHRQLCGFPERIAETWNGVFE
ncbi:MAG: bifunctional [glutamate--ammonia ligase]-adenylyl-L-tyrosine phosphorylase/[glutamate--ammonia-ligase] adenylyltransferase, partial [Acidiferrobacterales bacterium]